MPEPKPSGDAPLVSVYIPTHNRSKLLSRALLSVAGQTYRTLEIVVSDDGSTDDTRSVVVDFTRAHPELRIRYLRSDSPRGASAARNSAIETAAGAFVTGLDDDDEFRPERLACFISAYRKNPGVYFSNATVVNHAFRRTVRYPSVVTANEMRYYNAVGTQVFVLREKLIACGAFDPSMPASQDHDAWMRLILQEGRAYNVGNLTYVVHKSHQMDRISTAHTAFRGKLMFYRKYKGEMTTPQRKYQLFQLRKQLRPTRLRDIVRLVPRGRRFHELALLGWSIMKTRLPS